MDSTPKSYHTDPTLYLYTSLTSGSSHIISATSRMQTILKANKVDFQALDVATDEKARMLWGRRAGKRKLPGLVRFGMIVGDLEEVEEWNEYGELKENVNLPGPSKAAPVTPSPSTTTTPSKAPSKEEPAPPAKTIETTPDAPASSKPETAESPSEAVSEATPVESSSKDAPPSSSGSTLAMAMRQAGFEAAKKAGDAKIKARQEELEKLKAKAADLQKSDQSSSTGNTPSVDATEADVDKKPESGAGGPVEAVDHVPATEENKEGLSQKADETKAKDTESTQNQTISAAEAEMAKSADAATAEAAEPDELESKGQAQPESVAPSVEPEQPTNEKKPPHILNAKEAEEETNKAIIADEATHVHIAGSPPPYASPGMKKPKDVDEDEETSSPLHAAFKEEVERKEAESKIAPVESNEDKLEAEKGEGEKGLEEPDEAKLEVKDETQTEMPDAPPEPVQNHEEVAPPNEQTDLKKTDAETSKPSAAAEESKSNPSESINKTAEADHQVEEKGDEDDEEDEDEGDEEKEAGEKEKSESKIEQEAPSHASKTETEGDSKPPATPPKANDPSDADANPVNAPTHHPDPNSAKSTETETNTQSHPVASGEKAGESVED